MAIGSGEFRRIRYVESYTPIPCPNGQFRAEYFAGTQGFAGAPVHQQCVTTIDHNWNWTSVPRRRRGQLLGALDRPFRVRERRLHLLRRQRDGARIYVDGVKILRRLDARGDEHRHGQPDESAGEHTIVVEFFEDCCPAEMRVSWQAVTSNTPPTPTITTPAAGTTFKVGDTIQLQGSATDAQDGQVTGNGLRWDVILKHCPGFGPECHDHPLVTLTGATGQFVVPDHGDGTRFELPPDRHRQRRPHHDRDADGPEDIAVALTDQPARRHLVYDGTSQPRRIP